MRQISSAAASRKPRSLQLGYTYDTQGRLSSMRAGNAANTLSAASISYGYDTKGNFRTLTTGATTYTYYRIASSDLLSEIRDGAFRQVLRYESERDLLAKVENIRMSNAQTQSRYEYVNDAMGRRTSAKQSGALYNGTNGRFSLYAYDAKGQVLSAGRYQGSNIASLSNPLSLESTAYTYDNIGNFLTALKGANTTTYAANAVNAYSTVGSFTPVYDDDGNMVQYRGLQYVYDGENRLKEIYPVSPVSGSAKVVYTYDYKSRRVARAVYAYDGEDWAGTPSEHTGYLYDEWNVVAEYDLLNGNTRLRSYVWGLDKSGTLQGAGGVGGLLEVTETSGAYANQRLVFLYDANGNVGQIYKASDGSLVAQYEYDAFGNTLKATGDYAQANKYRFSTKPVDDAFAGLTISNGSGGTVQAGLAGGLYYYGYRFYAPALGRWINRDPIGEQGGLNLYAFVRNNGIDKFDIRGLFGSSGLTFGTAFNKSSGNINGFDLDMYIRCPCLYNIDFGSDFSLEGDLNYLKMSYGYDAFSLSGKYSMDGDASFGVNYSFDMGSNWNGNLSSGIGTDGNVSGNVSFNYDIGSGGRLSIGAGYFSNGNFSFSGGLSFFF